MRLHIAADALPNTKTCFLQCPPTFDTYRHNEKYIFYPPLLHGSSMNMLIYMIVGAFTIQQSIQTSSTWPPLCYEYDGTISTDFPCNPNAAVSACCSAGWECVSNLYCQHSAGVQRVGTCTQDGWSSTACPFPLSE